MSQSVRAFALIPIQEYKALKGNKSESQDIAQPNVSQEEEDVANEEEPEPEEDEHPDAINVVLLCLPRKSRKSAVKILQNLAQEPFHYDAVLGNCVINGTRIPQSSLSDILVEILAGNSDSPRELTGIRAILELISRSRESVQLIQNIHWKSYCAK